MKAGEAKHGSVIGLTDTELLDTLEKIRCGDVGNTDYPKLIRIRLDDPEETVREAIATGQRS